MDTQMKATIGQVVRRKKPTRHTRWVVDMLLYNLHTGALDGLWIVALDANSERVPEFYDAVNKDEVELTDEYIDLYN